MKYELNLKDTIHTSDRIHVKWYKRIRRYYRIHPYILLLNIFIIIGSVFVHPFLAIILSILAMFLPAWKVKEYS